MRQKTKQKGKQIDLVRGWLDDFSLKKIKLISQRISNDINAIFSDNQKSENCSISVSQLIIKKINLKL